MEIPSKGTHGLREVGLSMSTAVIQVPFELVQKWQEIVDVIAEIIHVPSALVMKVEPPNIKVFVSSVSNGNPYERDELAPLNTGLYCETVMKTRQSLLVPDALRDEEWNAQVVPDDLGPVGNCVPELPHAIRCTEVRPATELHRSIWPRAGGPDDDGGHA